MGERTWTLHDPVGVRRTRPASAPAARSLATALGFLSNRKPNTLALQSSEPERLLGIVADVMGALGHNSWYSAADDGNDMVVLLSPEHAEVAASRGWGPGEVQRHLFERSSRPLEDVAWGGMWEMRNWSGELEAAARRGEPVPPVRKPEGILLMVAGGPGKHSVVIPGFGSSRAVTIGLA